MVLSPRDRRLRSDYRAVQQLRAESSILEFDATGDPADRYRVVFNGKGLWRDDNTQQIHFVDRHEVLITLTGAYPRMIPELSWQTPIFHPNISAGGIVCLGGYGTHWVPSLRLDELCHMLWDMIRYENYDTESPYNREAAHWTRTQAQLDLPLDNRSLRNLKTSQASPKPRQTKPPVVAGANDVDHGVQFVDAEMIVDAEVVDLIDAGVSDDDILFIE